MTFSIYGNHYDPESGEEYNWERIQDYQRILHGVFPAVCYVSAKSPESLEIWVDEAPCLDMTVREIRARLAEGVEKANRMIDWVRFSV